MMGQDRIRWLLVATLLAGVDLAAIRHSREAMHRVIFETRNAHRTIKGGGPLPSLERELGYQNGRVERILTGLTTGVVSRATISPPTPLGFVWVWWPVAAASIFTMMAISFARSNRGRRLIRAVRLPRISTRGLMFLVAALGVEGGLVVSTMRDSGVNPEHANWAPVLLHLVALHAAAFLPAGIAAGCRGISARRA